MDCSKCGGYVMQETFFQHPDSFVGWKCLNCGRISMRRERYIADSDFATHYYQANNPPLDKPIIKKYIK